MKSLQELALRRSRLQRGQPGCFHGFGRGAEQPFGLVFLEPGQLGRFKIGRQVIGLLEQGFERGRNLRRQAEPQMDRPCSRSSSAL